LSGRLEVTEETKELNFETGSESVGTGVLADLLILAVRSLCKSMLAGIGWIALCLPGKRKSRDDDGQICHSEYDTQVELGIRSMKEC
jgi:hypothetical protein